jgi:glycyl-tRNA synthetase
MSQTATQEDIFKSIISHCKEYGFIFPSSEIYDGLGAVYDYGPYGYELKKNIQDFWWKSMVQLHENIVGIDAAIFMHPKTWKASGHVDAFNDPLIDNKDSKKRYRADVLIETAVDKMQAKIKRRRNSATRLIKKNSLPPIRMCCAISRRWTKRRRVLKRRWKTITLTN